MSLFHKRWIAEARCLGGTAAAVTATMLAQLTILAVETLAVARLSAETLAGVSLALSLFLLVFLFTLGLVTALTPLAAAALGRGDRSALRRLGQSGLLFGFLASLPGVALLLVPVVIPGLLPGTEAERTAATRYLLGGCWGLPAWVCYVAFRSLAVAVGRARTTTAAMLATVPLHAALTAWLVFGGFGLPPLGALGAGLSYSLAGLGAWGLLLLRRGTPDDVLGTVLHRPFAPDRASCRAIAALGLPFACRILLREGVMPAAVFLVAPFGAAALATHAVAARIGDLLGVFAFGFSDAGNMRVGFSVGANDPAQARRSALVALALATVVSLAVASAMLAAPDWLARRVLGGGDESAVAAVAALLPLVAALILLEGIQSAAGGALSGTRDGRGPLLIAVLGTWGFGLPLGAFLSWTTASPVGGVWTGLVAGSALTAALLLLRLRRRLVRIGAG